MTPWLVAERRGKPSLGLHPKPGTVTVRGWKCLATLLNEKDPIKPFNVLDIPLLQGKKIDLICGLGFFLQRKSPHHALLYLTLWWVFLSCMMSEQGKEMEIDPAKHLFLWKLVVLCWWCSGSSLQHLAIKCHRRVPAAAAAASCGAVMLEPTGGLHTGSPPAHSYSALWTESH